jgi:hypothetical protein
VKRATWVLAAAAMTAGCGSSAQPAAQPAPANSVAVERGALSSMVSLDGTLAYRARADASPYTAINQARGIYTRLPEEGDAVGCGDVLYRVDDDPVLLLCGTLPAYRNLRKGDKGKDVRQLNRTLGVGGNVFTAKTKRKLQHVLGTGALDLGRAVVLPAAARIAKVTAKLGELARPGAPVAQATSDTLEVQVNLDPTQQDAVKPGDAARITLPDNTLAKGTLDRLGNVTRTAAKDGGPASATIPASIRLDEPKRARGLDGAPVQVEIATEGVEGALSVPVTALVGTSGGGFAVEAVRDGARRELVAVKLGLFDTTSGRVAVEGALHEGDQVVVPTL